MRVRMISALSGFGGGVAVITEALASALAARGDPVVIQSDRRGPNPRPVATVPVIDTWTRDVRFVFQNVRALRQGPPFDVLHIQHEYNLFGSAVTAAEFPLLPRLLRKSGKPVVTTLHHTVPLSELPGLVRTGYVRAPVPLVRRVFRTVTRRVARWSDQLVVHSQFAKGVLTRDYEIPEDRISVIPLGVQPRSAPLPMEEARRRTGLPEGPVLLAFGYLAPQKGLETLIDAFNVVAAELPELRLVIAGGPPPRFGPAGRSYADGLQRRVDPRFTARALFTGFVPAGLVDAYFCAASLVVISYSSPFVSSATLAEAEGFGRPVLAPALGAFPEAVPDAQALYSPGSSEALAARLRETIGDESRLRALAQASRDAGLARSWDRVADLYHEVYARPPSAAGPPPAS